MVYKLIKQKKYRLYIVCVLNYQISTLSHCQIVYRVLSQVRSMFRNRRNAHVYIGICDLKKERITVSQNFLILLPSPKHTPSK